MIRKENVQYMVYQTTETRDIYIDSLVKLRIKSRNHTLARSLPPPLPRAPPLPPPPPRLPPWPRGWLGG